MLSEIIQVNDWLHLRKWRLTDASALVLNANNYFIWRWLRNTFPNPYTYEDAVLWIEKGQYSALQLNLAVVYQETAIGGIGIIFQEDIYTPRAEIGYWLGQNYWGKGIGAACLSCLTEWAFQNYSITRLEAPVIAGNSASMKILEKTNYHLEAIHRFAILKENILYDEYFYVRYAPHLL